MVRNSPSRISSREQNLTILSHHHVWLLVGFSYHEKLCLCSTFHQVEQDTNRKSQLMSCQSTEYFPKSLCDDLDTFWQMWGKSVFVLVNSGSTFNIMQSMDAVFAHSLCCCWNLNLNWGCSGYFGVTPWMSSPLLQVFSISGNQEIYF